VIDAVWRIESARIIRGLARIVRDVGLAEELAQDALVAALQQWPESGIPDNPGAWLMAAAKHRAIDMFAETNGLSATGACPELQAQQEMAVTDFDGALDDDIGDDLSASCSSPAIHFFDRGARCAHATLAWGLTTERSRVLSSSGPTIAQRIVRASGSG